MRSATPRGGSKTKKDYRGEMYVFTDLAAEAWPQDTLAAFGKSLDELPGTNVYLIDVGALRAERPWAWRV